MRFASKVRSGGSAASACGWAVVVSDAAAGDRLTITLFDGATAGAATTNGFINGFGATGGVFAVPTDGRRGLETEDVIEMARSWRSE